MTNSEKIQELSEIWGQIVGCDHHKNCDVNHYISTVYTYGDIKYIVEHDAYIGDDFREEFNTLNAAQVYLIQELSRQILEELNHNIQNFNNKDYEIPQTKEYWEKLLARFTQIKNTAIDNIPSQINFEEEYWNLKKENELFRYTNKQIEEILDKYNIPDHNESYPDMEYSLNYRVELLVNKLENQNKI